MMDKWVSVATTGELICVAKKHNGVSTPNDQMTDEEIRTVVRWIGTTFSEPMCDASGDILLNRSAVEIMLFITICEFPKFYCRYALSQYN
jgi:hypothetical protein